jgi:hypothetical protein
MPPLHQQVNNHLVNDDDEDTFFLPLDHRRCSDASDVSAYCLHPDDQALRRHAYRALQPKKVAVIGANASSIVCASTLRQDGHQVAVLAPSELETSCSEHQCHPDYPFTEHQTDHPQYWNYLQACTDLFGLTVKRNARVSEMTEKYGGWVLTYETDKCEASHSHPIDEYFDFVVIAASCSTRTATVTSCRFYEQYLMPFLLAMSWILDHLNLVLNVLFSRKSSIKAAATDKKAVPSCHFLPAKYQQNLQSTPQLFRQMLSPEIPQVAFMPQQDGASTYLASIWLSTLFYGEMGVPLEGQQSARAPSNIPLYAPLRYNDCLMRDLGLDHLRKGSTWEELFGTYTPEDYSDVIRQVQERRRISRQEGWAVPLTPTERGV